MGWTEALTILTNFNIASGLLDEKSVALEMLTARTNGSIGLARSMRRRPDEMTPFESYWQSQRSAADDLSQSRGLEAMKHRCTSAFGSEEFFQM